MRSLPSIVLMNRIAKNLLTSQAGQMNSQQSFLFVRLLYNFLSLCIAVDLMVIAFLAVVV